MGTMPTTWAENSLALIAFGTQLDLRELCSSTVLNCYFHNRLRGERRYEFPDLTQSDIFEVENTVIVGRQLGWLYIH